MQATGHVLGIPMPGHPVTGAAEEAQVRADVAKLEELVASHDAVFLLTDTRACRCLRLR